MPVDAARDALIALQGQLITVLMAQNSSLAGRVAQVEAANADLSERLARLERAVSRNSENSSMPPSADDLPGRTPPRQQPRRDGKKRGQGKQPGAPGSYLAWSEDPRYTVPLFPQGACGCGRDLAGARDLGVAASHQVIDVPLVTASVTQYDEHAVECVCGRLHAAAPPADAGEAGTVTYGLNVQAWCVFLMVAHHVPVQRCAEIIASLTGTRPSDGFVHAMLARAAKAVKAANMLIRALVITAAVISADETPIRVGPGPKTRKKYLLVACTNLLTCYFLGGRSMETFDGFVFPDLSGSVIVHDRYQNYDKIPGVIHQLCCQHLLRDIEDAAQSYPDAIWPGQAAAALRGLIHAANTARGQGLAAVPDDVTAEDLRLFRNAIRVGLSGIRRVPGANKKQPPARLLLECLNDREADVLRFLTDLRIPPTSNQAERDLRPAKTQQKISGRLRSEDVTVHRYAIRGYISTAAKHSADIITVLRDALAGKPWMPPTQECT